jgi:hypothetical protein
MLARHKLLQNSLLLRVHQILFCRQPFHGGLGFSSARLGRQRLRCQENLREAAHPAQAHPGFSHFRSQVSPSVNQLSICPVMSSLSIWRAHLKLLSQLTVEAPSPQPNHHRTHRHKVSQPEKKPLGFSSRVEPCGRDLQSEIGLPGGVSVGLGQAHWNWSCPATN